MIQESNKKEQVTDVYALLGTVDEFHTKTCFKLYMYAVGLAKQVNEYIDKGWLVLQDGEQLSKFVFYSMDKPCVAEKRGNCSFIWFSSCYDTEGKVWLSRYTTKKKIREEFQKIQICDPKLMVRLNCT